MAIFRRGRKDDRVEETGPTEADETTAPGDDVTDAADEAVDAGPADAEEERFNRARGPFDAAEVDDEVDRVDLGALRLTPVQDMQLRLELDQEQQNVLSAHVLVGDSGAQLQVFAAPRTMGVWPDIRGEIEDSVVGQGGTAEVVEGPLGRELVATIPATGADGRRVGNRVRFLGVDGPRWFLRAVISGPAATDPSAAEPLVEIIRNVVVVRDDEARPPREALPLRVPTMPGEAEGDEAAVDEAPDDAGDDQEPGTRTRSADDLRPFERGPEITEVR